LSARAVAAVQAQGARIEMVFDQPLREDIAQLVADADRVQMAHAPFRHELAPSIHSDRSPKRDSIAGHSLGMGAFASAVGPMVVRKFDRGEAAAKRDVALIDESSALAVLWT